MYGMKKVVMNKLTISKFAEKSGVSVRKLRQLHISGKLKAAEVTIGGHRRYDESQVEDASKFIRRMKLLTGGGNVVSGEDEMTPFFAYLLGLIFADGTVLESGQMQLELKDEQLIEDLALQLNVPYHPHKNRNMYRLTVPRVLANQLVEFGVNRNKSRGFDIPLMGKGNFGDFLRGLFDGDGSARIRGGCITMRFHGHPQAMAYLQQTFMEEYSWYLPWVPDNCVESGMLEISKREIVRGIRDIMYGNGYLLSLNRRREILFSKE